MTFNNLISIGTLLISLYSLYQSGLTKREQQNLEKEMQNNEFKFSRRKIWYDRQNKVLDSALIKLVEVRSNLSSLKIIFENDHNRKGNVTIKERDQVINIFNVLQNNTQYFIAHKHYFPKSIQNNMDSITNSMGHIITNLDSVTIKEEDIDYENLNSENVDNHMEKIYSNISDISNQIRALFLEQKN